MIWKSTIITALVRALIIISVLIIAGQSCRLGAHWSGKPGKVGGGGGGKIVGIYLSCQSRGIFFKNTDCCENLPLFLKIIEKVVPLFTNMNFLGAFAKNCFQVLNKQHLSQCRYHMEWVILGLVGFSNTCTFDITIQSVADEMFRKYLWKPGGGGGGGEDKVQALCSNFLWQPWMCTKLGWNTIIYNANN